MAEPVDIPFGDVTVPVYPQRWAYLTNRCGKAVATALQRGEGLTAETLVASAGDALYDVLVGLIPTIEQRMTREEFADEVKGPTIPEIREAFRVAAKVNEIDDIPGILGKALGPTGANYLRALTLEAVTGAVSSESPSSPSTTGESPSTTSTPTSPTSTESTDSLSAESAA